VIGKGSYAKVVLVRKKTNGNLYALKSMKKKYIEKKNQCQRIMT
jgi:serum/glucocorticoid-regulated kinase 2